MQEDGSALLLVLLVILVMLTITFSLTLVVSNEIKMSSFNQHRLKAIYKAESGVEQALNLINETDVTIEELESISGTIDRVNDYQITDVVINENGYYEVTSVGKSGQVSRTITVCLQP